MSKRKKQRAKSGQKAKATPAATTTAPPAARKPRPKTATAKPKTEKIPPRAKLRSETAQLIFGPDTYKWLGIGFGIVVLGFLLMIGGRGDDPTVFDESVIYSFRKITLAPIVILTGLGVVTYAIFKK